LRKDRRGKVAGEKLTRWLHLALTLLSYFPSPRTTMPSMRFSVMRPKRPANTSLRQMRSARIGEPSETAKMWCGVTSSDSTLDNYRRMNMAASRTSRRAIHVHNSAPTPARQRA
jgi:hypothetical protein